MDQDIEALRNYGIAMEQIRGILHLPRSASPRDIVAKVRETKSAADLAGATLQIERDSSIAITPETFAAWERFDTEHSTELTLFSDGSGILCDDQGDRLHEFDTPSEFAAFFD
jgi:hypothetical protein